jgi:hypothetical protein
MNQKQNPRDSAFLLADSPVWEYGSVWYGIIELKIKMWKCKIAF